MRRGLAFATAMTLGVGELALPAFETTPAVASAVTDDEAVLYQPDPLEFLSYPDPELISGTAIKPLYERGLDIRRRMINGEDVAIDEGVSRYTYQRCAKDKSDAWTYMGRVTNLIVEEVEVDGEEQTYYFDPQLTGELWNSIHQGDFTFNVYPAESTGDLIYEAPWLRHLNTGNAGSVRFVQVDDIEWIEDTLPSNPVTFGSGTFSILADDGITVSDSDWVSIGNQEICAGLDINFDGRIGFVIKDFWD